MAPKRVYIVLQIRERAHKEDTCKEEVVKGREGGGEVGVQTSDQALQGRMEPQPPGRAPYLFLLGSQANSLNRPPSERLRRATSASLLLLALSNNSFTGL